jgi:hypothetical protein
MGLSLTIAAGSRPRSHSQVIVPRDSCHILMSQIRDSPNLEGQVPELISPRNRVARLYPQALGSLFVASHDSQGYGGGNRTRFHTGFHLNSISHDTLHTKFYIISYILCYCILVISTCINAPAYFTVIPQPRTLAYKARLFN